jgi:hypothetical protein
MAALFEETRTQPAVDAKPKPAPASVPAPAAAAKQKVAMAVARDNGAGDTELVQLDEETQRELLRVLLPRLSG